MRALPRRFCYRGAGRCLTRMLPNGWALGALMGRRISMATREELIRTVRERYRGERRRKKARILDEFVAVTGYHRKHALRAH